ncbi:MULTISPECIES: hypothetical protein [Rhodococcus]|uniref:Uncharacterized protein n=1 Tax=Rhodococcus gordoniae TaxID=223392 RepID=A0A379PQU5_9NOCA|nr:MULTISPECIES: hypothetical protein [Rhodococcus]QXU56692.1 hypothetical protein KXC42_26600 [Rhodococcus sp. LW-XY12]SUF09296.1 Uncharacterised protein [Rhodococcus gordoniae]
MSRGFGVKQRQLLDAMTIKLAEQHNGVKHRWRWFTLEMCGLVTKATPRSERVALTRAVRRMAEQGILETTDEFPYKFFWMPWGPLDILGPVFRPGRKLWFRPAPDENVRYVEHVVRSSTSPPDELEDFDDEDWDDDESWDDEDFDYGSNDTSFWKMVELLPDDDVLTANFVPWWYVGNEALSEFFDLIYERQTVRAKDSEMGHHLAWVIFGTAPGQRQD